VNITRGFAAAATSVAATMVVLATAAGPASAHVRVEADRAEAGATDVTLTFTAGAESKTSGIASLRTTLPEGIAPDDVSLVSGPKGWKLKATDDGFIVSGIALPQGEDATYAVKFAKLPADAKRLALKTVERYGNGDVERWDDTSKSVAKEEENAAPVIELRAAGAAGPAAGAQGPSRAPATSSGLSTSMVLMIALVVAAALALGAWMFVRSRRSVARWS
jgi:hypothetical protein